LLVLVVNMPASIYFLVREDNFLVGAIRFNEDGYVEDAIPAAAELLIGQRREVIDRLCDRQGWNLKTINEYKK